MSPDFIRPRNYCVRFRDADKTIRERFIRADSGNAAGQMILEAFPGATLLFIALGE